MSFLFSTWNIVLLLVGFGFVIFWHELGHFLAAKWAGVKVEQFAVGFGQALIAWRKGLGFTRGTSAPKVEDAIRADRARTEASAKMGSIGELESKNQTDSQILERLGIGETEYRLNWIPFGGYVKMLGQDDTDATAFSADPRSYNMKSVGKRMVIVSAGVVMNVILAAIGFCVLYNWGFNTSPPIIGSFAAGSPAQLAGLQVGDRLIEIEGREQREFAKIAMNVALAQADGTIRAKVRAPDGQVRDVELKPRMQPASGMLAIGVAPSRALRGIDRGSSNDTEKFDPARHPIEYDLIRPGDVITEINGEKIVDPLKEYYKLDRALQASGGKPVALKVQRDGGSIVAEIRGRFGRGFDEKELTFAGMEPRAMVMTIAPDSAALKKLLPGDAIAAVEFANGTGDRIVNPSTSQLQKALGEAGSSESAVKLHVIRNGTPYVSEPITPNIKLRSGGRGLNVSLEYDLDHPIVARVHERSAAQLAGIPAGASIQSVNGKPVSNWHEVRTALASTRAGDAVTIQASVDGSTTQTYELKPSEAEIATAASHRYVPGVEPGVFDDAQETLIAKNALQALKWGVGETRDFILQGYVLINRMFQRSVPISSVSGPVGILQLGSRAADRGYDWLLWFLSMISANLAVVNFLPIPIVDGGLFLFLILEKLRGRPLSPQSQAIAQYVGLAVILSIFLVATYNDILRLFM